MGSQQVGGGVGGQQAAVLEARRALWLSAFSKLEAEHERTDIPGEDLLKRSKLVDERLGVLFGDRAAKLKGEPRKQEKAADRFKRYRIVG